ncbi:MAG: hypothetical protein WBF21_11580 [Steroidobacteraceae bacterium]
MCPGRRGAWIAGAIAALLAGSWSTAAPIDVLSACAAKAAPEANGIEALGAACPQLADALQSLGLEPMLYDGWQGQLNRDALRDLVTLAQNYGGSKPADAPDVALLPGILKALTQEQIPARTSWWDAFVSWLKTRLWDRLGGALTRLGNWLDHIRRSTTWFDNIAYTLVGLLAAAAAAVIWSEWRAGGARRRRPPVAQAGSPAEESVMPERPAFAAEPTELLRAIVSRLMQTGRLRAERSLTHRELVARGVFDDDSQRAVFAAVAGAAESIFYGPPGGAPERWNSLLEDGRSLLAQLSNSPGGR